ncbi:MAG: hypothetical protein HQK58_09765 [Deltaproteobacteria bacterium]|nr:hypothetical protein [Deltaproteobacteria bacterium]
MIIINQISYLKKWGYGTAQDQYLRLYSNPKMISYLTQLIFIISLIVIITVVWCGIHRRTSLATWRTPIGYDKDHLFFLGVEKSYMSGEASLWKWKFIKNLNTPFAANWNDYPITEKVIFAMTGWLGRILGLFAANNIAILLSHILAALTFWWVAQKLKYHHAFAFTGALLLALSHTLFDRHKVGHLDVAYFCHVPLCLLVTWWSMSEDGLTKNRSNWWLSVTVSVITGLLHPYYTGLYLQFLCFSVLLHFVRKNMAGVKAASILIAVTILSFMVINADTLLFNLIYGRNYFAVDRQLSDLEIYAMKIPELVMPPAHHRWAWWANFAYEHYFNLLILKGAWKHSYIGVVGIAGLLWLMGLSGYRFLQGKLNAIPIQAYQVIWIIIFSLSGGINFLLGVLCDFYLFRDTNRYCIFILTICLLFIARQLSRYCPRKLAWPVGIALLILGLCDQLPIATSPAFIEQNQKIVTSDKMLVAKMESVLPSNSMVFQLPVMDFPEVPPIHGMADYEHFRPYFFSKDTRFSYGSNKGRQSDIWQREVAKLPPKEMASALENYGFSAIYINRKGYLDLGRELLNRLTEAGKPTIASSSFGDLVVVRLFPSTAPILPHSPNISLPKFIAGWSADEGSHRWSISQIGDVALYNYGQGVATVSVKFMLGTLKPRRMSIYFNSKLIQTVVLMPDKEVDVNLMNLSFIPGNNFLRLHTDIPADIPNNGDTRNLSFRIMAFSII